MNLTDLIGTKATRRSFLGRSAAALGTTALASLLNPHLLTTAAAELPATPGTLPRYDFAPKIKRVIWLTMAGGPSHLETFDYKPKLAELNGQPMPDSFTKGQPIAQLQGAKLNCFGPQYAFQKFGQSGQQISDLFPHLGSVADEICIIRSMKTEAINHRCMRSLAKCICSWKQAPSESRQEK